MESFLFDSKMFKGITGHKNGGRSQQTCSLFFLLSPEQPGKLLLQTVIEEVIANKFLKNIKRNEAEAR